MVIRLRLMHALDTYRHQQAAGIISGGAIFSALGRNGCIDVGCLTIILIHSGKGCGN